MPGAVTAPRLRSAKLKDARRIWEKARNSAASFLGAFTKVREGKSGGTTTDAESRRTIVLDVIVAASIGSEKVTATFVPGPAVVEPAAGDTLETVGGCVSGGGADVSNTTSTQ